MPSRHRFLTTAVLLATAAFLAIAAGASGATRSEYIAAADQICAAKGPAADKQFTKGAKAINKGDFETGGKAFVKGGGILLGAIKRVARIPRPADLAYGPIDDWLKYTRQTGRAFIAFGKAAQKEDFGKLKKLQKRFGDANKKSRRAAKQVGFNAC